MTHPDETESQIVPQVPRQRTPAKTIRLLWYGFSGALLLTVIAQVWVHPHSYFSLDGEFWFYPVYGLVSSILLVLVSKALGFILKRNEDYWRDK